MVALSLTLDHLAQWVRGAQAEDRADVASTDMDVVILNDRGQVVIHPENPLRTGASARRSSGRSPSRSSPPPMAPSSSPIR